MNKKVAKSLLLVGVLSLSGCVLGGGNPILGKWELTAVTPTVNNGPYNAVIEMLAPKMVGSVYDFTKHAMTVYNPITKQSITIKVDKYKVESSKKVDIVQTQNKFGTVVQENQETTISDGGKDATVISGDMTLHLHKVS